MFLFDMWKEEGKGMILNFFFFFFLGGGRDRGVF